MDDTGHHWEKEEEESTLSLPPFHPRSGTMQAEEWQLPSGLLSTTMQSPSYATEPQIDVCRFIDTVQTEH